MNGACSACLRVGLIVCHPLLNVPICMPCNKVYLSGTFTVDSRGNENYCRWCGEGVGSLLLCDSCPKAFCERCIQNNFGAPELQRIRLLSERWQCFVCFPDPVQDLATKRQWDCRAKVLPKNIPIKPSVKGLICYDVARGREKIEIPVVNEVDDAPAPLDFVYVTQPVVGESTAITDGLNSLKCCTCEGDCSDSTRCECLQRSGGRNYDCDGRLIRDKPEGIFECNYRCSCHKNKCTNRIVGEGPRLRLQVYRCSEKGKGWGVRCTTDIKPGTFIADYMGELLPESESEQRGLTSCDEYLFSLDHWGRRKAHAKLEKLALSRSFRTIPRHHLMFADCVDPDSLKEFISPKVVQELLEKGAIERARKRSREGKPEANAHADTWLQKKIDERSCMWSAAKSIIMDRTILKTEQQNDVFNIDARWYGSVGRFLNHSCSGNVDIHMVFCELQDIRMPRVSFFANDFIPAGTELCYDYGYLPGNVEGKERPCLCGADNCRQRLY